MASRESVTLGDECDISAKIKREREIELVVSIVVFSQELTELY